MLRTWTGQNAPGNTGTRKSRHTDPRIALALQQEEGGPPGYQRPFAGACPLPL
jgi:hypothetical protein